MFFAKITPDHISEPDEKHINILCFPYFNFNDSPNKNYQALQACC